MLDNKLIIVRTRRRDWVRERSRLLIFIALLMTGWLFFSQIAEARPVTQQDRLTPIQREIERQRQRLDSTEVEDRRDALMRLGNLKRPDASRAAAAGLTDTSPTVRVAASHAVLSLPSSEAASVLLPLLKDKDEFVRREAAFALGETRDRSATITLVDVLLHDKKVSVRAAAAVALGRIGDEAAVSSLTEVVTAPNSKKKKAKSFEEEFVVRSAVRSLGQIGSRTSVPTLVSALQDETNSSDTRREAATALGAIGDTSALPALQTTLQSNGDPYLLEAARLAIRKISLAKTRGAGN